MLMIHHRTCRNETCVDIKSKHIFQINKRTDTHTHAHRSSYFQIFDKMKDVVFDFELLYCF